MKTTTRFILYTTLILGALALPRTAAAQIAIHRDSADFDNVVGQIRDIDFEDMWSATLQRVHFRNAWGLNVYSIDDDQGSPSGEAIMWASYGHAMTFPTRTRRVRIDAYGNPTSVRVTDFNDSIYTISDVELPAEIASPVGIRKLQFLGTDGNGNNDINWTMGIHRVEVFDGDDSVMADIDMDSLRANTFFLLSRQYSSDSLAVELDTAVMGGVTFTDPSTIMPVFDIDFNSRIDPDNPIGNLGLPLTPGGRIDFPEGVEGAMMILEPFLEEDSLTFEVTDWAGNVQIVGARGKDSATKHMDSPPWPTFLGFTSPDGIRSIMLLEFEGTHGMYAISTVMMAEMPAREVAGINMQVVELDTVGIFRNGEEERLQPKLEAAVDAIERNANAEAIAHLESFRGEVAELFTEQVLVPEEARILGNRATYVIERLRRTASGIADREESAGTMRHTAFPNPTSGEVSITYRSATQAYVALTITNVRGEIVRSMELGNRAAGQGVARWDGRDAAGNAVPGGLYFYTLTSGGEAATGTLMIVR